MSPLLFIPAFGSLLHIVNMAKGIDYYDMEQWTWLGVEMAIFIFCMVAGLAGI